MMKERKGSLHDRLYQMGKEKLRTQKSEANLMQGKERDGSVSTQRENSPNIKAKKQSPMRNGKPLLEALYDEHEVLKARKEKDR